MGRRAFLLAAGLAVVISGCSSTTAGSASTPATVVAPPSLTPTPTPAPLPTAVSVATVNPTRLSEIVISDGKSAQDVTVGVITRKKCTDDCDPSVGITSHFIEIMFTEGTKGTIPAVQQRYGDAWPFQVMLTDCSGGLAVPVRWFTVEMGGEATGIHFWDFADLNAKACGLTLHFFDYPEVQIPYSFFDPESDWT